MLKVGTKVLCIKSYPDNGGIDWGEKFNYFIDGNYYTVMKVLSNGILLIKNEDDNEDIFNINDDFEEYFMTVSRERKLKLMKIKSKII